MIELAIIGGGPAGMAAAIAAYDRGIRNIWILERDCTLGGILQQCIHNGFGLHKFGEELTGPEYAWRYEQQVFDRNITVKRNTTVLSITQDKMITATSAQDGIFQIKANAIILAMGCRERPVGALRIPGNRPSGIFSAGTAQKYINQKGYLPGKDVVILGSGDIGLIMARRMTLEGAHVHAVCEVMPYSGGLARNIQQCLKDFDIPLLLSHTVTKIHGTQRLTGVTIAQVDEKRAPIPGTEQYICCDTLLLSVGLIPENELTVQAGIALSPVTNGATVDEHRQTSIPGIFSCGNVLHVHDLVDYVSDEGEIAGIAAADYILQGFSSHRQIPVNPDGRVRYTVPQILREPDGKTPVTLYFRVNNVYRDCRLIVKDNHGNILFNRKKAILSPGNMEHVSIDPAAIQSAESITIGLEVQE